jgi:hypothetical protein
VKKSAVCALKNVPNMIMSIARDVLKAAAVVQKLAARQVFKFI